MMKHVPNVWRAMVSVHCHNDLGLAVANSIAGVRHGARQVECTINGIGERSGNAALEEIVMILRTRKDIFSLDTRDHEREDLPTSRLITSVTGAPVQPNKAIVERTPLPMSRESIRTGCSRIGDLRDHDAPSLSAYPRASLILASIRAGMHSGTGSRTWDIPSTRRS